jgi:phosphoglycolate phosphatase-like HAD superfamily hydrolase
MGRQCPGKAELIAFVEAAVNPESEGYIPEESRIAVFDLDGTLFCETDPVYYDHRLLRYRVLEDPDYKDKATDFEKEVAHKVDEFAETGVYPENMDTDHGKAVASSFKGMTLGEFQEYNLAFRNRPANGYSNLTIGDGFYIPMLEVVDYLQENGFLCFVVSGTDRLILRGICEDKLNIPFERIIGSDERIIANEQGTEDGLDYQFTKSDDLILSGEFQVKNLKMNKVAVIAQEIGKQPVLSFGNSSGDSSMANYTITRNQYPSKAFMLCCDDTVRENGNLEKAKAMEESCEKNGWIPISMKNDWKTIYGDSVTRLNAAEN